MAAIKQRKKRGLLAASVTVTVLAGVAAAILIMMAVHGEKLLRSDVIFPNISINGIAVGGMTAEEAELTVKTAVQGQYTADFEVRLPDRTITLTADKLCVSADPGDAVAQAVSYGRTGTAFDALAARDEAVDLPANAALTFDEGYIRQMLDAVPAAEATLPTAELNHREKVITVTLGTDGQALDTERLFDAVLQALSSGETALRWDYTTVPAGIPDLTALLNTTEQAGLTFELSEATAAMAATAPGERFSIPVTKLTTHN